MTYAKQGPLTVEELKAIWRGAVDPSFARAFEAAGEGNGFEAYTQAFAQLERVSRSVDVSTQGFYIRPWSGQTGEPASGGVLARVTLSISRTRRVNRSLVLEAGRVLYGEQQVDWGENEGVDVLTGRRYVLAETLVFHPGDVGPFDVVAVAERPGYGFNNPLPGTIIHPEQTGSNFLHDRATLTLRTASDSVPTIPAKPFHAPLVSAAEADMFVPEHVGQYVELTAGLNAGAVARVIAFVDPAPAAVPPRGSTVDLEVSTSVEAATHAGTFSPGELAVVTGGGPVVANVRVLGSRLVGGRLRLTAVLLNGAVGMGNVVTGSGTGATATVDFLAASFLPTDEAPVAGVGGASWRVLDWGQDWGITCTNALSPEGGRLGMLDLRGEQRGLPRLTGEDDEHYRARIAVPADNVTPNAIRRALNRALDGAPWCLREVGQASLPGFFYDGDLQDVSATPHGGANDAWDEDAIVFGALGAVGALEFQEPIEWRSSAGVVKERGYWGSKLGFNIAFTPAGASPPYYLTEQPVDVVDASHVTLTRRHPNGPPQTYAAGDVIVGLTSGAVVTLGVPIGAGVLPAKRWHVWLDYLEMRAMFAVGIQPSSEGDFGFAYDGHPRGAYDAAPFDDFYDGVPIGAAARNRRIWDILNGKKAGGVTVVLYESAEPCA